MNNYAIDVMFPDPECTYHGVLVMNVLRIGDMIMLSERGDRLEIPFNYDDAKKIFDKMCEVATTRHNKKLHPFPSDSTLATSVGVFILDAEIYEEISTALFEMITIHEIGDLLEQYPPN